MSSPHPPEAVDSNRARVKNPMLCSVWFAQLLADHINDRSDLRNLALTSKKHWKALQSKLYEEVHLHFATKGMVTTSSLDQYMDSGKSNFQRFVHVLRCTAESLSTHTKDIYENKSFSHLRELIIDVHWSLFHEPLLYLISPHNSPTYPLQVLKIPIARPVHCFMLGEALSVLPCLVSLTITDIPDDEEFLAEAVPFLGLSLRETAKSLRHLDITLTNPNRPYPWEGAVDVFVRPTRFDYHFHRLFPEPSREEREQALEDFLWNPDMGPEYWQPYFNLESLRLKNFGVPASAFKYIFDPRKLQKLCLPRCPVDPEVWILLAEFTQLKSLIDISHDFLDGCEKENHLLLNFLSTQTGMQQLTFMRPSPVYEMDGFENVGEVVAPIISEVAQNPQEHQTVYDVLRLANLLARGLKGMARLEHLELQGDLFALSGTAMDNFFKAISTVQHLEISFDYQDKAMRYHFVKCLLRHLLKIRRLTFISRRSSYLSREWDEVDAEFKAAMNLSFKDCRDLRFIRYHGLWGSRFSDVYYHRQVVDQKVWTLLVQRLGDVYGSKKAKKRSKKYKRRSVCSSNVNTRNTNESYEEAFLGLASEEEELQSFSGNSHHKDEDSEANAHQHRAYGEELAMWHDEDLSAGYEIWTGGATDFFFVDGPACLFQEDRTPEFRSPRVYG